MPPVPPRPLTPSPELRRLAIVFASTSACLIVVLLLVRSLTGTFAPNISVSWIPSVSESAREQLERQFQLEKRGYNEGATWSYDLVDTSSENIAVLLAEPSIVTTTFLDSQTFSVALDAPQGVTRTWLGDRIPILKRRGVMQTVGVVLVILIATSLTILSLPHSGLWLRFIFFELIPSVTIKSLKVFWVIFVTVLFLASTSLSFSAKVLTRTIPSITANSLGAYRLLFAAGLYFVLADLWFGPWPPAGDVQPSNAWLADWDWVNWIANQPALVTRLEVLISVALLLFGIGFWTRTVYGTLAISLVVWTLVRLHHTGTHNWAVALITVLCLVPVRWSDGLSLDRWIRRKWHGETSANLQGQAYGFAVWLPGLVLGTAMAGAAFSKLSTSGFAWISSGAVKFHFVVDAWNAPVTWGLWIASHHEIAVAASAFAVVAEGSLIIAAFARSALLRHFLAISGFLLLLGFYLFQNEVWYAWWFLWACFFIPWDSLFRRLISWIPGQDTWVDGGVEIQVSGSADLPLGPVHYTVIATVCALQLTASILRIEQQPLLSDYPMYSNTYESTAAFDDARAIPDRELRFITQTSTGIRDVSAAVERTGLYGPLRDVFRDLGRGEALSPELRNRVVWISKRYQGITGEPLGMVTLHRDEQGFDWSTGSFFTKEIDTPVMTLDTERLTWSQP